MQFSHGNPTGLATLTAALSGKALVSDTTYGGVECFAVTMLDGTAGAPAKLHALRGKLKAAGFPVRSAICALSAVLVQKAPESLHSPSTPHPSSHGLISGSGVGGESTYEPADVDLTACDCGGDTAYELADFESFATCRCCCSCGAPDSVVFDVHAKTDDDSDVEPHCHECMVEAVDKMLASVWTRDSFELRPLPLSDRALRLASRKVARMVAA